MTPHETRPDLGLPRNGVTDLPNAVTARDVPGLAPLKAWSTVIAPDDPVPGRDPVPDSDSAVRQHPRHHQDDADDPPHLGLLGNKRGKLTWPHGEASERPPRAGDRPDPLIGPTPGP